MSKRKWCEVRVIEMLGNMLISGKLGSTNYFDMDNLPSHVGL